MFKNIVTIILLLIGVSVKSQSDGNDFYKAETEREFKNYKLALEHFDELLKNNYSCSLLYYRRSMVNEALKDYNKAIDDLKSAIGNDLTCEVDKIYPDGMQERFIAQDKSFYYDEMGRIYMLMKNYPLAVSSYTKAIETETNEFRKNTTIFNRAKAKEEAGDLKGALKDFEDYQKNPGYRSAYFEIGKIKIQLKDYPAAISAFTKCINDNKKNGDAYFFRGLSYFYSDQMDKGCSDLSIAGENGIVEAYDLIKKYCN